MFDALPAATNGCAEYLELADLVPGRGQPAKPCVAATYQTLSYDAVLTVMSKEC